MRDRDTRAEYKQVTVLFADVVHSMDIAAAVGAERLREVMTSLVDRATAVVRRFGGTVDKFTGDGIMAVFGAPVALEDHAIRACLAALGIQEETARLAAEVKDRDGVELALRIGLNSGQVIAGEVGSTSLRYTTIGEQVGMAQRMESVAPPGGVTLSVSTARLVAGAAALGEPEMVHIKGVDVPVTAYRLRRMEERHRATERAESILVGRRWELSVVEGLLERACGGQGAVVEVVGEPGIGKSRLVREVVALAEVRGAEVFSTFCESHTSQLPFHAVARLLRAAIGVNGLDGEAARARVRDRIPDADREDALLLDDLLGVADPGTAIPAIDPDARRRRLAALVNADRLSRRSPTVYVVEDAHWIDEVSESMLTDFLTEIPQTPSLVLLTYRPEYHGALTRVTGAHTITLAPLSDSDTAALVAHLLGANPSVDALSRRVTERAAGNPFFAEELVRELAERGVLRGEPGAYRSATEVSEVSVPATLQATIAARIDRLDPKAKRTLSAAAVIGSRFGLDLLTELGVEPVVDELVAAQVIDQVSSARQPEYVFHHPLIHSVAYGAQLRSDRSDLHRRVAAAIEAREPESCEENAALIAEHLEAAGDLDAAYGWHMRAATWATNRDINAARLGWQRAAEIADALPAEHPEREAMRIAPRTMLCGTGWRVHASIDGDRFDELRELCSAAGDKASLGIATAGLVVGCAHQDRVREASQLGSEAWALAESIGDATLTVGLSFPVIFGKIESAEWCDVLRWSQTVIDLADGDPSKGNFLVGCPLALAFASRGMARYFLGRSGWLGDLRHGVAMARRADPASYAGVVGYAYLLGIPFGVLRPDDPALDEIENALRIAERTSDDVVVGFIRATLGVALVHRNTIAERDRGQRLLAEVGEVFLSRGHNLSDLPIVEVYSARETARRGDPDAAVPVIRAAADHLFRPGHLLLWGIPATAVLVETLLDRGADGDMAEADDAIGRLAVTPADEGLVMRDVWSAWLRALLARARGDEAAYPLAGRLPRHGESAWLRGTYRVGRGDAVMRCSRFGTGNALRAKGTATDLESLPHGVENASLTLAFAAVREHEPRQARHAARERVPLVEIEAVLGEYATGDVVVNHAEVVLDEREEHVRKCQRRLLPQIHPVDFVEWDLTEFVQEQQVAQEVSHERGQVQHGRPHVDGNNCATGRNVRLVWVFVGEFDVSRAVHDPAARLDRLGRSAPEHQLGRAIAVDGILEVVHDEVVQPSGDRAVLGLGQDSQHEVVRLRGQERAVGGAVPILDFRFVGAVVPVT
ncbi:cyclase [Mycobacterium mantenii]|uniref:Cyclase n=1 Tax=Mycobacterium mantenii TaxID=560555 RepID=A0ABM7JUB9_MYCNT|nr:cyclase [Mycobacterium mantenii]